MDHYGINYGLAFIQFFNIFLLFGAPLFSIIALSFLRSRKLNQKTKALWVLITFVPFLGPIAFWIVNPREDNISE